MMSLVLVCLARDREINLICSVSRQTPGRVDYNLLKSAGPPPQLPVFINSCCSARQGSQNKRKLIWGEGGLAGQQHWNMKETVDIYCFMSQSELWTQSREYLVTHLQSNIVQNPLFYLKSIWRYQHFLSKPSNDGIENTLRKWLLNSLY